MLMTLPEFFLFECLVASRFEITSVIPAEYVDTWEVDDSYPNNLSAIKRVYGNRPFELMVKVRDVVGTQQDGPGLLRIEDAMDWWLNRHPEAKTPKQSG